MAMAGSISGDRGFKALFSLYPQDTARCRRDSAGSVVVWTAPVASDLMPNDLGYIVLVFALFVAPQLLAPLRLPTAITALGMGAACGLGFGLFQHDTTLPLLSIFGIVALFLFAGLSVDLRELRQHAWLLTQHIVLRGLGI